MKFAWTKVSAMSFASANSPYEKIYPPRRNKGADKFCTGHLMGFSGIVNERT